MLVSKAEEVHVLADKVTTNYAKLSNLMRAELIYAVRTFIKSEVF